MKNKNWMDADAYFKIAHWESMGMGLDESASCQPKRICCFLVSIVRRSTLSLEENNIQLKEVVNSKVRFMRIFWPPQQDNS